MFRAKSVTRGGIYAIKNLRNGRHYVGQTSRPFAVREAEHIDELGGGTHPNKRLQADWYRYGARAFRFSILERAGDRLDERETEWILRLQAEYNVCWPGTRVLIQRDKRGRIIPLRTKKPAAVGGSWDGVVSFLSLAIGVAIGVALLRG